MRFAFYCGVVLVALAAVSFGLDWIPAPMPPMADVSNVAFVPPPPPPPRVATTPATPSAPVAVAASAAPSVPAPAVQPAPAPPAAAAPRPKCDVDACAEAYRSFRESDCTYNPSNGPRRLCTKGDPEKYARAHPAGAPSAEAPGSAPPPAATTAEQPAAIVAPEPGAAATDAAAPPRCNVSACAAAYPRSFQESDCTFRPSSGPRRVCEK